MRKKQMDVETTHQGSINGSSRPRKKNAKPGDRKPGRDKTGHDMYKGDETQEGDADEDEAVG
jgi:hypothetical protein